MNLFWKTEKSLLTEASRITVNIWLPQVNGQEASSTTFIKAHVQGQTNPNTSRIGHVSMQTSNNTYISWWPKPGERAGLTNQVKSYNSNYEDDCRSEGGTPDVRICFFSLNVEEIEQCFAHIEESDLGYVLVGDKKTTRLLNNGRAQSCCGIAYELLERGGILTLAPTFKDLILKWLIVTPENFAAFVKNAKNYELQIHPETQAFNHIENEHIPQLRSGCVVM